MSQIIMHHTASTGNVRDILNMFMQPNSRDVSANFLIAQNGDVYEVVNPDTGRAWTTGSGPGGTISPDHSAITMEVMDETGAPGWTISPAAEEAAAKVSAWASQRYGFTIQRGVNFRGHREMPGQSTACPGGMRLDWIANRANEIITNPEKEKKLTPEQDNWLRQIFAAIFQGGSSMPGGRSIVDILQPGAIGRNAASADRPVPVDGTFYFMDEIAHAKTLGIQNQKKLDELEVLIKDLIKAVSDKK